jgi:plastocyanin
VRLNAPGQATTRSLFTLAVLALGLSLLALAGCGSSSSSTSPSTTPATTATKPAPAAPSGTGQPLSLEANPEGELKYNKTSLTAKAGAVSINFTNNSPLSHNLTVESSGGARLATPTFKGGSQTLSLHLEPGTYKFFCTVPGHRAAGMEGTLTVH